MLMDVGFGAVPTNLTTPLRVAVAAVAVAAVVLLTAAGGPAFTGFRPEMQINAVSASMGMSLFVAFVAFAVFVVFVIQTTFLPWVRGT
jgi:hypothetical protein